MSNQKSVVPFSFEGQEVRVVEGQDGKPWYCAVDVCGILGYALPRKAVYDHCKPKGVLKYNTLTAGGPQHLLYISEPNLYRLICCSHLPAAEKFEAWVFEVLIPSAMRCLGVLPPSGMESLFRDKYIAVLEDDRSAAKSKIAQLEREIRRLRANMPCSVEDVETFMLLRNAGYSINKIARTTQRSRGTVKRHLGEDNAPDIEEQIRELTEA